jgi:DUF1680 family protein
MKAILMGSLLLLGCVAGLRGQSANSLVNTAESPYARLAGTALDAVRWTEGFWAERFDVAMHSLSPRLMETYLDEHVSHAFTNFSIAAGHAEGAHAGPPFHDGDFYKVLEATASLYALSRDAAIDRQMDTIIAVIAAAQRSDGYLHTPVRIIERQHPDSSAAFADRLNFETYNLGHLMTAACIHHRATGKRTLLDVAIRATDYLYTFYRHASPELARNAICPSHYMGVVEMYRTTRDSRYLELARSLIDIRGLMDEGTDDNQDRIPFRAQTEAMGHAVRANYLYAGVADVYAETGDTTLLGPLHRIWKNMTETKMYITGACGALYDGVSPDATSYSPPDIQQVHQAYGRSYQLPNLTAHNETCANIGNLLWNWRMFLLTGDACYTDIVERTLYNSILSGVSLDGKDFCYTNPLRVSADFPYALRWEGGRIPYIALSNCCPPNTARTLAEVQNYAYSVSTEGLWVNLYGGNTLHTKLRGGGKVGVQQTTDYPWDGEVGLAFTEVPGGVFSLFLRIPAWCEGARVSVNGIPEGDSLAPGTYIEIRRQWTVNDHVTLSLPMEVQLIQAHPLVEEVRNQVAVQRGPIVYCLESADVDNVRMDDIILPSHVRLTPEKMQIGAHALVSLTGYVKAAEALDWSGKLYRRTAMARRAVAVRLIPYYAWGNRGETEMMVWMNVAY